MSRIDDRCASDDLAASGLYRRAQVLKLRYFFIIFPGKIDNLAVFGHLFDPLRGSLHAFFPGNPAFMPVKSRKSQNA